MTKPVYFLNECIHEWSATLSKVTDVPRLEAEILSQHITGMSSAQLITQSDQAISAKQYSDIQTLLESRLAGKPIAYILGHKEFYSLDLEINESVLIPRPETELLVDAALAIIRQEQVRQDKVSTVLDMGTGSGAIALAIGSALNLDLSLNPGLAQNARSQQTAIKITALDSSRESIKLAQKNAENLSIKNIRFIQSDWFSALNNKHNLFDLIVSNPPYIDPQDAHLQQGDLRFEPISALAAGEKGMADLAHIISHAARYLNSGACLILEHGYAQAKQLRAMFKAQGFLGVTTLQDLNGLDRVTYAKTP